MMLLASSSELTDHNHNPYNTYTTRYYTEETMNTNQTENPSSLTTLTDGEVKNLYPGRTGVLEVEGLTINVKIVNARKRFGHLDFLITPTGGFGERWIQSNRIRVTEVNNV